MAVAAGAAIGALWAMLRGGRKKLEAASKEDIDAAFAEVKDERARLIALLDESRQGKSRPAQAADGSRSQTSR